MNYYEESKLKDPTRSNRYRTCRILKDKSTGEELLSTREMPDIALSSSDLYHNVRINEVGRLDLIAYTYYKNALLWWVIAQANDISDPFTEVSLGRLLRIPNLETLYGYKGVLL